MTDEARVERNKARLQECFDTFRSPLASVLADLQAQGFRPRIQCAWRSPEDEQAAHASGVSEVTFGFHNCTGSDGTPQALAADVLDDDRPLQPSRAYLLALARTARKYRLTTGIVWGLPLNIRLALDAAITTGGTYDGKIGWDPEHVECVGITILQAKNGARPKDIAA